MFPHRMPNKTLLPRLYLGLLYLCQLTALLQTQMTVRREKLTRQPDRCY